MRMARPQYLLDETVNPLQWECSEVQEAGLKTSQENRVGWGVGQEREIDRPRRNRALDSLVPPVRGTVGIPCLAERRTCS